MKTRITLSCSVALFIAAILSMIQIKLEKPFILAERFITGGGWIEIFFIALYGGLVAWKMYDKTKIARWRRYTWTLFSVIFFAQLILGIIGFPRFLMTGKLHLPIPMMILAGPLYRNEISFMTILFLSTVILTGPAWCSHLCYFGAFDNYASTKKNKASGLKRINQYKFPVLIMVVFTSLIFRTLNISVQISTYLAGLFGITGLIIIIIISSKKGRMVHCITYCPIGTLVNYLKFINPFRLKIHKSCDACMKCTVICKYDALKKINIEKQKPGITCTLCGDCITSCHTGALQYKVWRLNGEKARNIYLFLTISVHSVFLALARI